MSKLSNVWVFSDSESRLAEVMTGASALGDRVSVFVLGNQENIKTAYALGANKVFALGEKTPERIVEDYAETMADVISKSEGSSLVLLPAMRRCKALAARLGARLKAGVLNDASEVNLEQGAVCVKRRVYGGLAVSLEKIISPVAIVTVSVGVFTAAERDDSRTGETVSVDFLAPKSPIRCIGIKAKQGESVDLGKARVVVSVGRGIGVRENIALAQTLCEAIGAELGCSRPIAENEHWMEHERYVGISGVMIKPDVYIALGISGQIQHMVGVSDSQIIVAVNKDKNAPVFQYADYGIVGDLLKVVPILTQTLNK